MGRIRHDVKVKYDNQNKPVDILAADNVAMGVVTAKTDPTSGVVKNFTAGNAIRQIGNTDHCARFHSGFLSTGTRAVAETYSIKMEAEAPWQSVALMWANYETNIVAACKASVAATETFATDTQANRYQPIVGGTTYNAARSTGNYGWEAVTWAGASTVDIPAATGVTGQKAVVSDFMSVGSVPRADGGSRPLLLIRAYHDGATQGGHTYESRDFAPWRTASAINRGRVLDVGIFTGDAIAALGSSMGIGTKVPLIAPIFRYAANVISVAAFGDSITNGTGSASGVDNWLRRACFDLSTVAAPVVPSNFGFPSQTSSTYLAAAKVFIPLAKPVIAFYAPYSPNDGTHNQRLFIEQMARAADFVKLCKDNGTIPVLWTPVPNGNITESSDTYRRAVSDAVIALGASAGVIVADMRSATAVKGTPDTWISGLNNDTLHPNDNGHEAMSVVAKDAIIRATWAI
jgi:lysophospholipase L1-like esterase